MKCRMKHVLQCWRYEAGAHVPVWVAQRCHKLNDNGDNAVLTCRLQVGSLTAEAKLGDWIVFNENVNDIAVLSDEEFKELFEVIAE